jgi:hypothetical protein
MGEDLNAIIAMVEPVRLEHPILGATYLALLALKTKIAD